MSTFSSFKNLKWRNRIVFETTVITLPLKGRQQVLERSLDGIRNL